MIRLMLIQTNWPDCFLQ